MYTERSYGTCVCDIQTDTVYTCTFRLLVFGRRTDTFSTEKWLIL